MGSNGDVNPVREDEITFLVTGFGPFRVENPINPSWEVAKALPPFLPPSKSKSTTSTPSNDDPSSSSAATPPVRILVYPEPIRVSYTTVRELVPGLWPTSGEQDSSSPPPQAGLHTPEKVDFMIHIGMASGRKFYSIERRGHRDGYGMRDVDEQLLGDFKRRQDEGDNWIWAGLPDELLSAVDVDDVWRRWRCQLPDVDARVSEDAGRYLCDFIYFSSLAELEKRKEKRRVLFLHVPVEVDEKAIATGVDVVLELIRAVVQSEKMAEKQRAVGP